MSDRIIYHITSVSEWKLAQSKGEYEPQAFAAEGFIHCSYVHQLEKVVQRFFKGQKDLVVLEINPAVLRCEVIEENLEGGTELFPHVYGKLPLDAIIKTHPIVELLET